LPQHDKERFQGNYEIVGHEEPTEDEKKEHDRRMKLALSQVPDTDEEEPATSN
jgi:hypothetical protein